MASQRSSDQCGVSAAAPICTRSFEPLVRPLFAEVEYKLELSMQALLYPMKKELERVWSTLQEHKKQNAQNAFQIADLEECMARNGEGTSGVQDLFQAASGTFSRPTPSMLVTPGIVGRRQSKQRGKAYAQMQMSTENIPTRTKSCEEPQEQRVQQNKIDDLPVFNDHSQASLRSCLEIQSDRIARLESMFNTTLFSNTSRSAGVNTKLVGGENNVRQNQDNQSHVHPEVPSTASVPELGYDVLNSKSHHKAVPVLLESDENHHGSSDSGAPDLQHREATEESRDISPPSRHSGRRLVGSIRQFAPVMTSSSSDTVKMSKMFLNPFISAKLPPCIYSTPLLLKWCLYGVGDNSIMRNYNVINLLLMQWFALLGHYTITLIFLFFINKWSSDVRETVREAWADCAKPPTDALLRAVSFVTFYLCCGLDCVETRDMWLWVHHLKTEEKQQPRLVIETLPSGEKTWANGLTKGQKGFFYIIILIPKSMIVFLVAFVGTRFLHFPQSDGELLLNCVALLFIMEIDNMIYRALTPESIQHALQDLPRADISAESRIHVIDLLVSPWIWTFSLVFVVSCVITFEFITCYG